MRIASLSFLACLTLVICASPAQSASRGGAIAMDRGIAGVNLGLQLGPAPRRSSGRAPRTVTSLLGRPSSVSNLPRIGQTAEEKDIYLAQYRDDGLAVYFSKRDVRGRIDHRRDRYDRVIGISTYSSRYTGTYAVGKPLSTAGDAECAPLDRRAGANGPRRVFACPINPPGRAFDVVYLSAGNGTRASQRIQQVTVFEALPGLAIFQTLVAGALEDLDCQNIQCN